MVLKTLDHAATRHEVTIALEPERLVRGRLIDLQGQPAAGVKVHLLRPDPAFGAFWFDRSLEGLLPFWPRPTTTDDKGRFLVRGLGRAKVTLDARHPRLAPQHLDVQPVGPEETKEVTLSLAPTRVLRGRVTYADTRKPAPDTRAVVISAQDEFGMGYQKVEGRADSDGRFALSVFPGEFLAVIAHPPAGTPYLVLREVTPWAAVARQGAEFRLARGTLVRGTVTEEPSGKPVAGARVQYRARENNNPFYRPELRGGDMEEYLLQTAVSSADGKFTLAVPPGPGHLLVLGPTLDYVHVETSWGQLEYNTPGRERLYPNGLVALDLKPESKEHEVTVTLRRGMTVKGRVLGPDGKPVDEFKVLSRSYLPSGYSWWRCRLHMVEGRNGRFELPGCDPEKPLAVHLFDPKNELGATVTVSGKQAADGQVTIRLERCGTAVARFVTAPAPLDERTAAHEEGKPLANHSPLLQLVLTPGATRLVFEVGGDDDNKQELEADWVDVPNLAQAQYTKGPNALLFTDAEGRITFPALIPGATYRIVHSRPEAGKDATAILSSGRIKGLPVTDFTAKAGEAVELPDITDLPRSPRIMGMSGRSR
jgi:protocatechuate 3,4-dioxygenase beta subunit